MISRLRLGYNFTPNRLSQLNLVHTRHQLKFVFSVSYADRFFIEMLMSICLIASYKIKEIRTGKRETVISIFQQKIYIIWDPIFKKRNLENVLERGRHEQLDSISTPDSTEQIGGIRH